VAGIISQAIVNGHEVVVQALLSKAVQVEPMKPLLKVPGIKRLKLLCDKLLSSFVFNFNLRRYSWVRGRRRAGRTRAGSLRYKTRRRGGTRKGLMDIARHRRGLRLGADG